MDSKDLSEKYIIYDIKRKDINIFGSEFVKNNKNICKMIIDNKEYEITAKFNVENYYNNKLKIRLKGVGNITNMNCMFNGCTSLSYIPDISNWNTKNVTNMRKMFNGCALLSSLPDISNWNTNNVTNMNSMFNGCLSLSSIPDISKRNTSNVTNMSYVFSYCFSLSSLPDISKWCTNNLIYMSNMFNR